MAAYALRHLGRLSPNQWHQLAKTSLNKLGQPQFQVYLLSAAYVLAPADSASGSLYANVRNELLQNKVSPRKDDRMEMAAALSVRGERGDFGILDSLLK